MYCGESIHFEEVRRESFGCLGATCHFHNKYELICSKDYILVTLPQSCIIIQEACVVHRKWPIGALMCVPL